VVDVQIDDSRPRDRAVAQQHADRDGDVVERAESLAVVWEGVMQAAADVARSAAMRLRAAYGRQGKTCGRDGAAGHQPKPFDELLGPWELELAERFGRDGAAPHGREVFPGVDER